MWFPWDFLSLRKCLFCSLELSRTTETTWPWGMWSCCFSRSGPGGRIFSWKLSIRFANKEISSMRIFSIMSQVSFFLFKHSKFWLTRRSEWTILARNAEYWFLVLLRHGERWWLKNEAVPVNLEVKRGFKDVIQGFKNINNPFHFPLLSDFSKSNQDAEISLQLLDSPEWLVQP